MFWNETIPRFTRRDAAGRSTEGVVIAGALEGRTPHAPPPSSWAARPEADVAVWTLRMEPEATWTLPPANAGTNRVLYFFAGGTLRVGDRAIQPGNAVQVRPEAAVPLHNGGQEGEVLLLQGRPIGEPVVQHGPFVMNTTGEIRQAMLDYQAGGFGRWPWPSDGPVHSRGQRRFAIHADGREELAG
jgi:hypothetical protein